MQRGGENVSSLPCSPGRGPPQPASRGRGPRLQRRGENVCYYQNHIKRRQGSYYTMSFVLDCKCALLTAAGPSSHANRELVFAGFFCVEFPGNAS